MPDPPIPVPSKAAIKALRGLLFGTSCTLALVVEDRRRRISAAQNAIRNADRIRSFKLYHAGGSAVAAVASALDEDVAVTAPLREPVGESWQKPPVRAQPTSSQTSPRPTSTRPTSTLKSPSSIPISARGNPSSSPTATSPEADRQKTPTVLIRKHYAKHGGRREAQISAVKFETCMRQFQKARRSERLEDAVGVMQRAVSYQQAELLRTSARLCRTYQELGLMGQAQDVLALLVRGGQVDEKDYFAHHPLSVVESLLPSDDRGHTTRKALLNQLHTATALFLPAFSSRSGRRPQETGIVETAKKLLRVAFSLQCADSVRAVYGKVVVCLGYLPDFTRRYFDALLEEGMYTLAIDAFLDHSSTWRGLDEGAPDIAVESIPGRVVEAVAAASGYKAEVVLRRLLSHGPERLRATWLTELLYRYWRRRRHYGDVSALFRESVAGGVLDRMRYPDAWLRVMIQISLEAGERAEAAAYHRELASLAPEMADDFQVLGFFALSEAEAGDWEAVRAIFEKTKGRGRARAHDRGRAFLPILKEFARTHAPHETEAFVRTYVDELGVGRRREIVTVVAEQHGRRRDASSFLAWLRYCVEAGFPIDAGFTNAVLANLRRHWKLDFNELRTLFRMARVLSRDFGDAVTEQVMTHAALSGQLHRGGAAVGRLLSLRLEGKAARANSLVNKGEYAAEARVYLAMKEALATTSPARAVQLYLLALREGMAWGGRCLQLAVRASAQEAPARQRAKEGAGGELLHLAEAEGVDVNAAAADLLSLYIDNSVDARGGRDEVLRAVQAALQQFEAAGLRMTDRPLHRAALKLCEAGHFAGAVSMALSAAKLSGGQPGYNRWNFSVLLRAYAAQLDLPGLRQVTTNIVATNEAEDDMCHQALRSVARRLERGAGGGSGGSKDAREAHAVVEAALVASGERRRLLREQGRELAAAAVELMRKAALAAGCEPVDFADFPFLGSKELSEDLSADLSVDSSGGLPADLSKPKQLGRDLAATRRGSHFYRPCPA